MGVPDRVAVLRALVEGGVRFVVIGQVAATLHGSAYPTFDLDICYDRRPDNIRRLVAILRRLSARLRVGGPESPTDLPFLLDERTIEWGGNFTFETDLGALDCLAWPAGVGGFDELSARAVRFDLDGVEIFAAAVDDLLLMKRKAGRRKDLLSALELEEIKRMRDEGEID